MKQLLLAAALLLTTMLSQAQGDAKEARETAKNFMRNGDYPNAILVLNRSLQQSGDNLDLKKDLAFAYFLNRDYVRALEVAKPFADRDDAELRVLRRGIDFDQVVLAVSLGMIPTVAAELLADREHAVTVE